MFAWLGSDSCQPNSSECTKTGRKILLLQQQNEDAHVQSTGSGHQPTPGEGIGPTGQEKRFPRGVLVGKTAEVAVEYPGNIGGGKGLAFCDSG